MFYQADGTIYNGYLTVNDLIDCCDIEKWGTHTMPLGYLGYNATFNPFSMFLWGESGYSISSYTQTEWGPAQTGEGIGKIKHDSVIAIDSFSDGSLVILEGSGEFSIERWSIGSAPIFKYGTGEQGDSDDKLNNPKDVTVDLDDYVYVLDILSNGQPRIKVFDSHLQPVMGTGDSTLIPGNPISCDWDDNYDALHVLHSDGITVIPK